MFVDHSGPWEQNSISAFFSNFNIAHTNLMIPSEPHLTGKRKADDSNPLLAAAKRAKKEVCLSRKKKDRAG